MAPNEVASHLKRMVLSCLELTTHPDTNGLIYYIPTRGSGVFLQSKSGTNSLSLLNPDDSSKNPRIEILNQAGKSVAEFPAKK